MSEDRVELADLYQAELDASTLDALFADLAAHAEIFEVRSKGGARAMAGAEALSLEQARALLAAGAVRGIQIRYRFEGEVWLDTLLAGPTAVRLVRARAPVPPAR